MTFKDIIFKYCDKVEYFNCLSKYRHHREVIERELVDLWNNSKNNDDFYKDNLLYSAHLTDQLPFNQEVLIDSLIDRSLYIHSIANLFRYTYSSAVKRANVLDYGSGVGRNGFQFMYYDYHVEFTDVDSIHYRILQDIVSELNRQNNTDSLCWELPGFISPFITPCIWDAKYDIIICTQVMEHLENPIGTLEMFREVLNDNGLLILEVFFDDVQGRAPYHLKKNMDKGFNNPSVWKSTLIDVGFKPLIIWDTGEWRVLYKQSTPPKKR